MAMIGITLNGRPYETEEGATILSAATAGGLYLPSLCHHPDLPPLCDLPLAPRVFRGSQVYGNEPTGNEPHRGGPQSSARTTPHSALRTPHLEGCGLCMVEVEGQSEPVRACHTPVSDGMSIKTESEPLRELRRANLMRILARHPHACITCAQREGCSLEDCSSNVPKEERCCGRFHDCELRKVAEYVGVKDETPRYRPAGLPVLRDEPLFVRDFNLCIDCARCVRVCNQVRGVEALGAVRHGGRLVVGSVAPTLMESACKYCGACVEVCPTGCLTDKHEQAGDRRHWLVPCVGTCPASVDVPGYIRRIAAGDFAGAAALVWEKLPLANVLGHVCFHDCEGRCRRAELDEPIAICALKRFALEAGDGTRLEQASQRWCSTLWHRRCGGANTGETPVPQDKLPSYTPSDPSYTPSDDEVRPGSGGKKVAVVGAGPAGLAAAYFLRFKGHAVTIFEATRMPGGMPAQSIPRYRLPQDVLDKDLAVIQKLGVTIKTETRLATGEAIMELLDEGYDALLITTGLPNSRRVAVEGSHLDGVLWGLEFLRGVRAGERFDLGQRIVVIGGGNVAIDVAMTALRLSGESSRNSRPSVRLFCLERREEMPAHVHEIEKAEAEGVEIKAGWGPGAILGGPGDKVRGVAFRRCTAVFDEHRSFSPKFDEQERTTVDADVVILAVGQESPQGVPVERRGVFMAGDIAGGQMSVVHAVASGRAAAERIDRYLGGDGSITIQLLDRKPPDGRLGREEGFAPRARVSPPCAAPAQRRRDFRLIEETYSADQAVAEARRCLQCDLRLTINRPPLPPEKWLALTRDNVEQAPAAEGVMILADADKKPTLIKGTENIQAGLLEKLDAPAEARFFFWEEDRMYTQRESELIQQHLKQYGELPGGGSDELDDLFD